MCRPSQDPEKIRQAHGRRAAVAVHRESSAAALLHHRADLAARQGVRGHDGLRLPLRRRRWYRRSGSRNERGRICSGSCRAEHFSQRRRRARHHARAPERELDLRAVLAAAAGLSGLRLAAVVAAPFSNSNPMKHIHTVVCIGL